MSAAVLIVRLGLAAMFAVAGTAKLRDRPGTRTALAEFGVPAPLLNAGDRLLPATELIAAALLLIAQAAKVGALLALVLLVAFTAAIGVALARGKAPECHCFGQFHRSPTGPKTLVRNVILVAAAAFVFAGTVAGHTTSLVDWIGPLNDSQKLALAAGLAAVALFSLGTLAFLSLLRLHGRLLVRIDRLEAVVADAGIEIDQNEPDLPGLAPGSQAPSFTVANLDGEAITLGGLLNPGLPLLLVFTSPTCGPCHALLPTAAAWQRRHSDLLTVALAVDGTLDAVRHTTGDLKPENVLVDEGGGLYAAFGANGTPGAVLIAPDGRIASRIASGSEQVGRLVADAVAPPPSAGLTIGEAAPDLPLALLDGGTAQLASFRGRETLLLFWDPGCGFCREMYDRVLGWERSAGESSPQLLVVSSGDPKRTRGEGFRSPVVLDSDLALGEAFGADGTPMAALLDIDGRLAVPLASGQEAVFALAR